ncbi:MAG: pyruvate:ferredoxin (flavodoxin) oxidoreductase, partial [Gemmatimonadota bacterium]
KVVEMQSEGGAAGAVHGSLQTGALATTFTASQGLLLMIPNMYKIAGELTSTVFHVASRSIACQALSIFGDHSDVMATRATGFALLCSSSVQEAHDMALIAQAATLESRVPFLHFLDGFRTSHEINKIHMLSDEQLRAMIDEEWVFAHRRRALSPDHPVVRGTAQNPDVFFQARESVNPFYAAAPGIVERCMERLAGLTGRRYRPFQYYGAPDASRVLVLMGSGVETARETVEHLAAAGAPVGVVQVHLYRPFSVAHLLAALPGTVRALAVLDRTKEPGSAGEPLYQDVVTALMEARSEGSLPMQELPQVIGGRYGLSSKEFTPAMVKAVLDELEAERPRRHFTVGIHDDVSHTSLPYDPAFQIEPDDVYRAIFFGLGSDGTVGANKNTIKILGERPELHAQGFFVYDSKKAGSRTVSHLRVGPRPIRSTYLVRSADFVGVHQFQFVEQIDVAGPARPGGTLLFNSPYGPEEVWDRLPRPLQEAIRDKGLDLYVIDAYRVAGETGLGTRINTIMQTCFFAISGVIPQEEAIARIKRAIEKTYGRKGAELVRRNFTAVDRSLANLHRVVIPAGPAAGRERLPPVPESAPRFVREVTAPMLAGKGDELPVSALPADGTYPVGTAAWEKRNVAQEVPVWEPDICIQCGNCVFVCPHAVIRSKLYPESELEGAPDGFPSAPLAGRGFPGMRYTLQVAVEDCTGCLLCVEACPARSKETVGVKAINMRPKAPLLERERANLEFFERLPERAVERIDVGTVRGVQYLRPLFEYSGACAGCGETPYLKLLTQLFGDRLLVANATGCSSIYGGNLPTTPWSAGSDGRGPAWSNSLFEDNAEFGYGFRVSLDKQREHARELVRELADELGAGLAADPGGAGVAGPSAEPAAETTPVPEAGLARQLLEAPQRTSAEIAAQRRRVAVLEERLRGMDDPRAARLLSLAENLVRRSVWIVGGDGWAYDIGYGGLDHVLASGRNVNVLVLDTEVYSNTGGQASKATPRAAVAKFAAAGKQVPKKDLGLMAIAYGNVYVAQVAMGAMDQQTIRAFLEAEAYEGPSLIVAYAHCIAHGIDMRYGLRQQKLATASGYWPLYRYRPDRGDGVGRLILDSPEPSIPLRDYAYNEIRYRVLSHTRPEEASRLLALAERDVREKWAVYRDLERRGAGTSGGGPRSDARHDGEE